jgi:spore germination protein YaaH
VCGNWYRSAAAHEYARLAVSPGRARSRGPQRVWIVLALVLALHFPALSAVADAAPSSKRLQAFLLTSSPDSLSDLEAHAGSVGVVYPTWFDCRIPSGRISGRASSSIASYASARHIALMPRFNCQDGGTVHRILTDPILREATLTRLVAIGSATLVRGVCLDLENDGAEDREALSSFVAALAGRLHARHRRLAVVVDGVEHEDARISTGFYDDRALSAVADTVFVLAWGTHWEGSAPGPISSLSYVEGVARYVASLPHASRFVLGAPMYGLDWAGEGGSGSPSAKAYQYDEVVALQRAVGAIPHRDPATGELSFTYTADGVLHHVWYLDAHAVAEILRVGRLDDLAVGVWRLGMEDQRLWSSPVVTGFA